MSLLLRILDTDSISYEAYGFWGCLGRRLFGLLPVRFRQWWIRHIRTIYAPQHSNLRAAIPKTWCDLDGCIESFLFACVIDFVEGEDGLKDWEGQDEMLDPVIFGEGVINPRRQQAAMLKEVYEWAKVGRQAAENRAFATLHLGRGNGFFHKDYTEYGRITEETEAKTKAYLKWVLEYSGYMWT